MKNKKIKKNFRLKKMCLVCLMVQYLRNKFPHTHPIRRKIHVF